MLVHAGETALAAERTALGIAGAGCRSSQQVIIEALKKLDGVTRIEPDLIPEHLLIDHRTGAVTAEGLAAFIDAGTGGQCHAVVMRSCITAGIETRRTFSPPSR